VFARAAPFRIYLVRKVKGGWSIEEVQQ